MKVTVYGKQQLMARLVKLPAVLDLAGEDGVKQVASNIRDLAKTFCPVDTGSLKTSIRLQVSAAPATHVHRVGVSAGGYVTNPKSKRKVDYARHVEFGTSKTRAQPYLRPAIDRYKRDLPRTVKTKIRR